MGEVVLGEPDLVEPELLCPTRLFQHVGEHFLVGQLRLGLSPRMKMPNLTWRALLIDGAVVQFRLAATPHDTA